MEFDFNNNRYFGHASTSNPDLLLEEGLLVNEDVYGKRNLLSTTTEIKEDDISNGEEYLVKNVFSIGVSNYRKYLVIISFPKEECDINKTIDLIVPENIVGYYDENVNFYENDLYIDGSMSQ